MIYSQQTSLDFLLSPFHFLFFRQKFSLCFSPRGCEERNEKLLPTGEGKSSNCKESELAQLLKLQRSYPRFPMYSQTWKKKEGTLRIQKASLLEKVRGLILDVRRTRKSFIIPFFHKRRSRELCIAVATGNRAGTSEAANDGLSAFLAYFLVTFLNSAKSQKITQTYTYKICSIIFWNRPLNYLIEIIIVCRLGQILSNFCMVWR